MKVYHYTSFDNWKDIQQEGTALQASRRVGRINKEAYDTGALFALLDPVPKNWTENEKFPDIWMHLKKMIGKVLLEIEIDENNKNVFVVDRGEVENFLYKDNSHLNEEEKDIEREIVEGKYIASKTNLFEYIKNEKDTPFLLPEVIITKDVPLENVAISEYQPLLKEMLDEAGTEEYKSSLIARLEAVPELRQWYKKEYPQLENNEPSSELAKRWK